MYQGTLSSSLDSTFKYKIKTKELPIRLMMPIPCEVFVFTDDGRRKIKIEMDTEEDILYLKSIRMNLVLELPCKVKFTLENARLKKIGRDYLLEYSSATHN